MARPARPWFRLYVETVHDLKLRRQPPEVRWVWIAVLACARQSPEPGVLLVSNSVPMTVEDIADVAAVSADTVAFAVDKFIEADMLHVDGESRMAVINWTSRQFESDNRASSGAESPSKGGRSAAIPPPKQRSSGYGTTSPDTEDRDREQNLPAQPDDGFDAFWAQYPTRNGKKVEKSKAVAAWNRLSKANRELATIGVKHYAASGCMPKDAHRWLRDECWVDWQTPAAVDMNGHSPARPKQVIG